MNNSGSFILKVFITVALIFSIFTMTLPWVQVSPALSSTLSIAKNTNNAVADGISMIVDGVTSLFGSDEASGRNREPSISEARDVIIQTLSDEKEVVGILSKGECTPYDCSRLFGIVGNAVNNDKSVYVGACWLFYGIFCIGIMAVVLALRGRYDCSILYVGSVAIYTLLIYSAISKINKALGESAFYFTDSLKLVGIGLAAVAIPAVAWILSDDEEKGAVTEPSLTSRPVNQGNRYEEKTDTSQEDLQEIELEKDTCDSAGHTAEGGSGFERIENGEPEERAKNSSNETEHLRRNDTNRHKLIERAALCSAVFFITAGVIYSIVKKETPVSIDLSSYADLTITGYDGYGKASCGFDTESFMQDLEKLLADKNTGKGAKILYDEDTEEIAQHVFEDVQIAISEESYLYNGDQVYLDVTMDPGAEKILEQYNVKVDFIDAHISQEVVDLPEVKSYDPFEDITVSFEGAEPYGEAYAACEGDYWKLFDIEVKPENGLRNGDQVEVSVLPVCSDDELIEEYGVQFTRTKITMDVHGLMYYPERIEDLGTEELSRISETAKAIALTNILEEYESDEKMAGLTDQGQYFASFTKEDAQLHNQLYCVYEVNYANTSGKAVTYYYYVQLENIMVDPVTGEAVVDYDYVSVPRKPSIFEENMNLSEFVVVRLLPPRILSGFMSVEDFYDNYILPLQETCILSSAS